MKSDRILTIPNIITFFRILIIPMLFLFRNDKLTLIILAIIFWVSDLEGIIARKLNQVTKLGASLDKIADGLFVIVSLIILTTNRSISPIIIISILASRLIKAIFVKKNITNEKPLLITKLTYLLSFIIITLSFIGLGIKILSIIMVVSFWIEAIYTITKFRKLFSKKRNNFMKKPIIKRK